jgi:serine protease Do
MKSKPGLSSRVVPPGVALVLGLAIGLSILSCMGRRDEAVRVDLSERLRSLSDTQDAFASVALLSEKWVVSIEAREESRRPTTIMDLFFSTPERVKGGSGVLVDPAGWILTNRHVVEGATSVTVTFADGRKFEGKRYKAAARTDLAFVKIDGGPFETAPLGDSDEVRVGDWAIAIGSPFSFDQTLTVGVISAKGRKFQRGRDQNEYEEYLQTDAAINAGNSGGPLLNLEGKVIGINTAIFSPTRTYAGIGFAIPINKAKAMIPNLEKETEPVEAKSSAWLGVEVRNLREDEMAQLRLRGGLVVLNVVEDSPALEAGLQQFDVLVACGETLLRDQTDLEEAVGALEPGKEVLLKVLRNGRIQALRCRLGKRG